MRIEIYTDGACSQKKYEKTGTGGWAYYVRGLVSKDGKKKLVHTSENSGGALNTNISIMELTAILKAFEEINPVTLANANVHVYSDSKYAIKALQDNIPVWQRNGWRTEEGLPVVNKALILKVYRYIERYNVTFHKVRAHKNHPHNQKVNDMAVAARLKMSSAS